MRGDKAIQMEFPNNGGDEVTSGHLLTSNKAFSAGSRLHPIVVGQSGPMKIQSSYKIIQAFAKNIGCSQTDDKSPLLKTLPIQLIEHGEVKLVPT